jgi:hypothetical protein
MEYQTLTLEYAHQLVAFPEMYLIFSDWQSFNKVDVEAMSYLSNTKIPIRLSNVQIIEPDCAKHLLNHKGFLEIGISELADELLAKSVLNGRDHLIFSNLKLITKSCYKYFEYQKTYIHFKELNQLDDDLLNSLSKHAGGLSFDKIKGWNKQQSEILKSHIGDIALNNQNYSSEIN